MGELTELVVDRTQAIPFKHEGRPLKARPMPLRLALKLDAPGDDGKLTVAVELMAECISECVVFEDDGERVYTTDQILDADSSAMVPLFKAVSTLFGTEEAKKNSKASQR